MQTIFRQNNNEDVKQPVIAANSEVFKDGTLVSKNSSGFLIVATAGVRIYGICREDVTVSASNQTVAKVCPLVIDPVGVDMSMLGDQALTQTDLDTFMDISTVSAGLQTVAVSTATTSGQLAPQGMQSLFDGSPTWVGNTTQLIVRVAELQDLAYAQA